MKTKIYSLILIITTLVNVAFAVPSLLQVNGKYLYDDCGEKIILKGVNLMPSYVSGYYTNATMYAEIAKTGANTVRIGFHRSYTNWAQGGTNVNTTAADVTFAIQTCVNNNMIPIITLHDFTGAGAAQLPTATAWYTQTNILNALIANQSYLIINIANEIATDTDSPASYYQRNKTAITTLRNAGLTCPIMLDGIEWAKQHQAFTDSDANGTYGQQLLDNDPQHNVLFSIHAYWATNGRWTDVSDAQVTQRVNAMANSNLPFVFGELAKSEAYCDDPAGWCSLNNPNWTEYAINYPLLLQLSAQHEMGYMVWYWGSDGGDDTNTPLSMTTTGMYANLTTVGNEFVHTGANPLDESVRPYKMLNGTCKPTAIKDVEANNYISVYKNSSQIIITSKKENLKDITIFNLLGQQVYTVSNLNTPNHQIDASLLDKQVLILKVNTINNAVLTKKIMN